MVPSPYNDNIQFIQTRDSIVISNENIHDARIVPIDGRPHGSGRRWLGDSRGRWDGDTLVRTSHADRSALAALTITAFTA